MQARSRSLKVLDYAMSGTDGTAACEVFVEALGLKTLFSTFMGKVSSPISKTLLALRLLRRRKRRLHQHQRPRMHHTRSA